MVCRLHPAAYIAQRASPHDLETSSPSEEKHTDRVEQSTGSFKQRASTSKRPPSIVVEKSCVGCWCAPILLVPENARSVMECASPLALCEAWGCATRSKAVEDHSTPGRWRAQRRPSWSRKRRSEVAVIALRCPRPRRAGGTWRGRWRGRVLPVRCAATPRHGWPRRVSGRTRAPTPSPRASSAGRGPGRGEFS